MKPCEIDKTICDYSFTNPITEKQLATLAPFIFNRLFADGNVHTMPDDGQHYESDECFCHPKLSCKDSETGKEHWTHTDTRKEAMQ